MTAARMNGATALSSSETPLNGMVTNHKDKIGKGRSLLLLELVHSVDDLVHDAGVR